MSRMDDWAIWTLTGVAPFVVAGLIALATPLLLPSRGLRRELSLDVAMLDKLPAGTAQADLTEDVEGRAVRLNAWSRYPTLTRSEMFTFALAGVILFGTFLKVGADLSGEQEDDLGALLSFVSLVASLAMWALASWSWHERAVARLGYLAQRSPAPAVEAARGRVRMAVGVLWIVVGLIVIVQLAALVNAGLALWDSTGLALLLAVVWALLLVVGGYSMTSRGGEVATEG
jgi:hypothetical protein